MAKTLILTGFMASGKTSVGRKLAAELGWSFRDSDAAVEQEEGRTVSEIFAESGESGFREAEERIVMSLLEASAAGKSGGTVISLGGGAVTNPRLLERLRKEPLVFFLDQDVGVSFKRARSGRRPLAGDEQGFRDLHRQRQELYRQAAGVTIDARGKSVKQLTAEIVGILKERTGKI